MERFLVDKNDYMVGTKTQEGYAPMRKTLSLSGAGNSDRSGSNAVRNRLENFNAPGPSSQFSEE